MVELMSKADLEKCYLETTYSVFIDDEKYNIEIGKSHPSVLQKLVSKKKSAAILTAWNPKSQILSLSENKSRNIELKSCLKNYTVFNALGQGMDLTWQPEESFFIQGITKIEVDKLAIEFEQFAYVWCERNKLASLIFTDIWLSLRTE